MGTPTSRRSRERLKEQARAQDENHRKWAARHPARARDERQLRKFNAAVRKDFGHKVNGTPETCARASVTRQGAVARLFEAGDIDAEQLGAAQSIAQTHARITGDVTINTSSFETRVDQSGRFGDVFYEKLGAVRAEVAYSGWRQALPHPALVLAVIVEDQGISIIAKRFGMRNARAKKILIDALDLWRSFSIDACKTIDDATLAAAQAGFL
jgi:hypothetical protein